MRRRYCIPTAVGFCLILLCIGTASGHDACRWEPAEATITPMQENPNLESDSKSVYTGTLQVYVAEIDSRWLNEDSLPFHNALLSFAIPEESIVLGDLDTLTWDVQWDGNDYTDYDGFSFGDVREENIKVIAAVFNSASYPGYSDPPSGNEFEVHELDACAAATCGQTGYNDSTETFTHTVFAEDGSTTWCPSCTDATIWLHNIEQSGDYPFHYASLVVDKSPDAASWMANHYNLSWLPTNYFDGGYRLIVGPNTEQDFRDSIEYAGARDVFPLFLSVSVEWLGDAVIDIHVEMYNTDPNFAPTTPPAPVGDAFAMTALEETYSTVTTDQNGDSVYYMWDFGGQMTDWLGPYESGEQTEIQYLWLDLGVQDARVKAKDGEDAESEWSDPLVVDVGLCGDADRSGAVDIDDVVYLVSFIFVHGPAPNPLEVANADCSGGVGPIDIDDVVYIVNYIFLGGPAPCELC